MITKIRSAWRWLREYWYVPVFALVTVLGWLLRGFVSSNPITRVKDELEVIKAGERAHVAAIDRGTEAANALADLEYKNAIEKLEGEQMAKAEALRTDPRARVRYLRRIIGTLPRD